MGELRHKAGGSVQCRGRTGGSFSYSLRWCGMSDCCCLPCSQFPGSPALGVSPSSSPSSTSPSRQLPRCWHGFGIHYSHTLISSITPLIETAQQTEVKKATIPVWPSEIRKIPDNQKDQNEYLSSPVNIFSSFSPSATSSSPSSPLVWDYLVKTNNGEQNLQWDYLVQHHPPPQQVRNSRS